MRPPDFLKQFSSSGKVVSLVDLSVTNGSTNVVEVCCPDQHFAGYSHRIGELRFAALSSIEPIDVDSDDFDGWVYPDGSEYPKERFPDAWAVFGDDPWSTTFRVPCLSTFFKPNPFPYGGSSLSVVPAQTTGIPPHRHSLDPQTAALKDVELKVVAQIPGVGTSQGGGSSRSIHARGLQHGTDRLREGQYSLEVTKASVAVYDGELQSRPDGRETHPNYNLVPVKIYIGGGKPA